MLIQEQKEELVDMAWETVLKRTLKPREKMYFSMFGTKYKLFDNIEEVMPEIDKLTNLFRTKVPEYEANTESTFWILDKHLTGRLGRNPNADTITTIKEIIRDLTDNINRRFK